MQDAAPDGTEMTGGWYDAGGMPSCNLLNCAVDCKQQCACIKTHFTGIAAAAWSYASTAASAILHLYHIHVPQAAHAAADFLKLNFPAAFSASLLAWGLIEFPDVSTSSFHPPTVNSWPALVYCFVVVAG